MLLSVIIVSYNVRCFLEQCLLSVEKAVSTIDAEIIVIDNASTDDTVLYIRKRFPATTFIQQTGNSGFAKANNLACARAKGKYVLFLNPDTLVPEDCFTSCIGFMEAHANAGACGIRMLDGSGNFLPESKRGFPTPWVSFSKMSGLASLFPSSRLFAGYYHGNLDQQKVHEVDALAGAFMLLPKKVFDLVGGFDEQFFMYAEDIDLSYRVKEAGYQNYYLPTPAIVHFKGESTLKDARYVRLFYKAMEQFVDKHEKRKAPVLTKILKVAIRLTSRLTAFQVSGIQQAHRQDEALSSPEFNFLGDPQSCAEARQIVDLTTGKNRQIVNRKRILILCEGNKFPFTAVISELLKNPGKQFGFHGKGSSAIVSSSSKNGKGEVIEKKI